MGLFGRLLGSKKKALQDAMSGIDMVKAGLSYYVLLECEDKFGKNYAYPIAAAVVNTIFSESPSTERGREFIQDQDNFDNVKFVIENKIKPKEKLRQIITDAIRVKCTLANAMYPNLSEPDFIRLCQEPVDNLKRLGLLISGGEMPDLGIFLRNASIFINECKAKTDNH